MGLNILVRSIEETLTKQVLVCMKSRTEALIPLPNTYEDADGRQHVRRSPTYRLRISNSLVKPIQAALKALSGSGKYITLNSKNLIAVSPSREYISSFTGKIVTLQANVILTEKVKELELVEYKSNEAQFSF